MREPNDAADECAAIVFELSDMDPFNLHTNGCAFCGTLNPARHHDRCLAKRAAHLRWRSSGFTAQ